VAPPAHYRLVSDHDLVEIVIMLIIPLGARGLLPTFGEQKGPGFLGGQLLQAFSFAT
jgi:hypothetical protein